MHTLADWTVPLLAAIPGDRGGWVHTLADWRVPLLPAIAGCHCWATIAGDRRRLPDWMW